MLRFHFLVATVSVFFSCFYYKVGQSFFTPIELDVVRDFVYIYCQVVISRVISYPLIITKYVDQSLNSSEYYWIGFGTKVF